MLVDSVIGDLTVLAFDVAVNAANPMLAGGGGLDGAMHAAAGPELLRACMSLPLIRGVRCPTGEARLTPGFRLPSKWVAHAVGPVYASSPRPEEELAAAYRSALEVSEGCGASTVGLPAISCGIYGFPPELAAKISVKVCRERSWKVERAVFVLFDAPMERLWSRAIRAAH